MTEDFWLACDDWRPMLAYLEGKASRRKHMLYACAGLRCLWHLVYDHSSQKAFEVAERAADGWATDDEVSDAVWSAEATAFGYDFDPEFVRNHLRVDEGDPWISVRPLIDMGVFTEEDISRDEPLGDPKTVDRLVNAANAVEYLFYIDDDGLGRLTRFLEGLEDWPGGWLVREVFGNPFRPGGFRKRWETGEVLNLASEIYAERAYGLMPRLGAALRAAGCRDVAMLDHCSGQHTHVRGCWLVDQILGKG